MNLSNNQHFDVIIIGGGASGMMAAGTAARNGERVLILEKNNELGKKLKITGGGRCNITNAVFDHHNFLKIYGDAGKFLFSAFNQFDVRSTFDFFEQHNLPLVIQARNRVFPHTQKATDVCHVMERYCQHEAITIRLGEPVIQIISKKNLITGIQTRDGVYSAHRYIIASGGCSHPETGSSGDGFTWLQELGHTFNQPTPHIVPIRCHEEWVHKLAGVSLSFMKITFFSTSAGNTKTRKAFSRTGKILFTHFGISGPLILNSASNIQGLLDQGAVTASIDCYPDTDIKSLDTNILRIFDRNKNKLFKNIIKLIVPHGMSDTILDFGIIDPYTKVHSITADERSSLIHTLKGLSITITGVMGMDWAVISDGGIPLHEMDMRTMRSKIIHNMYVTGDMLHIHRPSGGYSLQLCWTTGYIAGISQ